MTKWNNLPKTKRHKFGAKKTTVDGITFDSKAESERYKQLKLLKRAGHIKDFELQPTFEIIPSYRDPLTGKKIAATKYKADFRVIYPDGREVIEDVKSKGTITPTYRLKKKLFESQYEKTIIEVMA